MGETYKIDFAIKTLPRFLAAAAAGEKTFTVRKNDRPYKVGSIVRGYFAWLPADFLRLRNTYVLTAKEFPQGLKTGYCVCGIKLLDESQAAPVLAAYEVIKKIEETLNFEAEQSEYFSARRSQKSTDYWARAWYERAAIIHDLINANAYGVGVKK